MSDPTKDEIERVAVAIADAELEACGSTQAVRDLAATYARDVAVDTYGHQARAAIIALRSGAT